MLKKSLITLLKSGIDVNYGKISLCSLQNYHKRTGWQVHSDEEFYRTSEIYKLEDLEIAVARFIFIRRFIKNEKSKIRDIELSKMQGDRQAT